MTLYACQLLESYKPIVEQGNILEHEQLSALKLAMSKQEVRALLGSPVISNIFHNDIWLYVNNSSYKKYQLKLVFKNNRLVQIIKSNLPTIKKAATKT